MTTRDAANGLASLNDMLHGWAKEGVDIQHVDLALSGTLLVHASYVEGIRYNLAVRLAPEYPEAVLTPLVEQRAHDTYQAFRAHNLEFDDDLRADRALQPRFFSRRLGTYDINEG